MSEWKQWTDMSTDEIEELAQQLSTVFIAMPGVVGAPLIVGADDYWVDVSRHMIECGVRMPAEPIKHYEPGDSLDTHKAAGKWLYDTDAPAETYEERIARLADEEHQAYLARIEELKAAQSGRQERVAEAEAVTFANEVRARKEDGTYDGSPHSQITETKD